MNAEPRQDTGETLKVDRHRGVRHTRLDTRTRAGRRARELREYYAAVLAADGRDVSAVELISAILRAAELQAISEHLRADALRGRPVSPDDLVRLERLSAQALRALRLPSGPSKPPLTLGDLLRADQIGAPCP
jgi:hypothetical protein